MAEEQKGKAGRPTIVSKLAEEADKRGFMLVPKQAQGLGDRIAGMKTNADGIGKYVAANLPYLFTNIDINDFEAVCEACIQYFAEIAEQDIPPSVPGLCLRLGVSRHVLNNWRSGKNRDHRYKELAERCYALIESATVEGAEQQKINPVMSIFILKNNHGYSDEQKVVVENKESVVDDTLQMEDVLALAGAEQPKKAEYTDIDNSSKKE